MSNAIGTHLLIDLYTCLEDVVNSPLIIQESVTNALEAAQQPIDEISCHVLDNEVVLFAVSPHCHVAVDIYTFDLPLQATLIMRVLKQSFGAERVKATSINRGDFGSIRDMKPRKKSSLSAMGRVTRTRMSLKKTGSKLLKSTGKKVFNVIAKKRDPQPRE